jgi:hypothetical protein
MGVQAMVDKITAQRDVEYITELLAKETDENRRVILQRLLADAERLRQTTEDEDQEEISNKKTLTKSTARTIKNFPRPCGLGAERSAIGTF